MPKPVFRNMVIAFIGDFGPERKPQDLKRWVEAKSGRFSSKVEDGVTHVVCSAEAYEQDLPAVQQAKAMKKVYLATYDWFEDCTLQQAKHRPTGKYSCKVAYKANLRRKQVRKAKERKMLKKEGGHDPESASGIALSFFDKHLSHLKSKTGTTKPDIEEYTLYDDLYKTQADVVGEGGDDGDEEAGEDKDEDGDVSMRKEDSESDVKTTDGDEVNDGNINSPTSTTPSLSSSSVEPHSTPSTKPRSVSPVDSAIASSKSPSKPTTDQPTAATVEDLEGQQASTPPPALTSSFAKLATALSNKPKKGLILPGAVKSLGTATAAATPSSSFSSSQQPLRPYLAAYNTDPHPDVENHHLYFDQTGFKYNITLVRIDITKNSNERFVMRLYESHTSPHTYAVHVRFFSGKKNPPPKVLDMGAIAIGGVTVAPMGSEWARAFQAFKGVFEEKTGLPWEERLDKKRAGQIMPGTEGEKYFKYAMPKVGEPRGIFPANNFRSKAVESSMGVGMVASQGNSTALSSRIAG